MRSHTETDRIVHALFSVLRTEKGVSNNVQCPTQCTDLTDTCIPTLPRAAHRYASYFIILLACKGKC